MTDAQTNGLVKDAEVILGRTERIAALREHGWKLDLPNGEWVQLRDPASLTEHNRKTFKETGVAAKLLGDRIDEALSRGNAAVVEVLGDRQAAAVLRTDYIAIAMFVQAWSFDLPVPNPSSLEPLGQLPGQVFDRLSQVSQDLMSLAFLDTSVSRRDDAPFDGSAA